MKNLVVVLSFIMAFSCKPNDKTKQENVQVIEAESVIQTDTLVVGQKTEFFNENNNEMEYSFVIKGDTLNAKFLVRGNEDNGYQIRHYPVPRDRFIWLHKLSDHLATKKANVNSISLGKLVSQPFANEITNVYRAKHSKDVSTEHYESLEEIIMDSELVTILNEAIKSLGVSISSVGVEKVFYMKSNGVEMLNCMVWVSLLETK